MNLTLRMNGLMAYAIEDDTIDALLVAGKHGGGPSGHHSHGGDHHTPALLIPLEAIKPLSGSATPDFIFDAGSGQYGVWQLTGVVVHVRPDGKAPAGHVVFRTDGTGEKPDGQNDDSLYWLPSIRRACETDTTFRPDCLPPGLNPHLVNSAVRMADGKVVAMWATADAKTQVFAFDLPPGSSLSMKDYQQALADGVAWTLPPAHFVEILLTADAQPTRSIFLRGAANESVVANICNNATTIDGQSVFDPKAVVTHFGLFYDIVEPPPSTHARRLPSANPLTTKTNRCPGSSG